MQRDAVQTLTELERLFFLLMYAPTARQGHPEPITGRTWLQKEMFALIKAQPEFEEDAGYEAWRYGSFSEVVEEQKDQYQISGYVEVSNDGRIRLTSKGEELASQVWSSTSEETTRLVSEIKKEYNDMNESELLLFMYVTYPETAENSTVRDEIIKRRVPLSMSLYNKGKVSLEKAAELAGMGIEDFLRAARQTPR